ncbi:MAG TPA: peptidoglycan-associated lipoprotein Pal [Oligoflexia bacterium]|nr:peptidoglycan-associated lipoprotein Pal [Oligoflexia bacterium]HMR25127.1 peptidoglycan-associated lipoprotein Pal [Oligoflexia bacterium]
MFQRQYLAMVLCLCLTVVGLSSCGKKKASEVETPPTAEEQANVEEPTEETAGTADQGILANMPVIYFEFDQSTLSAESRTLLQEIAAAMNAQSSISLTIEGHTDERGSNEYNLALGERRARSVQEYIQRLGVSADRLNPVSYGEERPSDPSTGEAAWSKNRRVEFTVSQ